MQVNVQVPADNMTHTQIHISPLLNKCLLCSGCGHSCHSWVTVGGQGDELPVLM